MSRTPATGEWLADRPALAEWGSSLIRPAAALIDEGSARLNLGPWGADYDAVAAEMEAFVRPLWGGAPLAAGVLRARGPPPS